MNRIRDQIEKRITDAGPGYVFTRKDFQDIASSGSIGQILSRMVKDGLIRQIGRGIFDFPTINPTLGGQLSPDIDQTARAIARKFRWSILPYGNLAANRLGLSQQVPAKLTYLSDGPTKELKIDNRVIYFKHARPKEIYANSYISGLVVQALRYFGKDRVGNKVIARLKQKLSRSEKNELLENIHYGTEWIHEVVQKIAKEVSRPDIEKQICCLFTAELQFRLTSAVRLATTLKVQPLDIPTEWTHGQHRVRHEEIALRHEQADYAACFLHRSATFLMAVAIKDAIRAVVPDPKSSSDFNVQSAYQIARLIRNAFAHAPFAPKWSIDPDCHNKVFSIPGVVTLDTTDLHGTQFDWRHYGGPLAMFRFCRFVRTQILKDQIVPRKHIPLPGNVIYQQGNLILKKLGDIE